MKYVSIDELNSFEFHDAELKVLEYNNGTMRWILRAVNATTENSQNSFPTDMCIKEAEIVLECAKIVEIEFSGYMVHDSNNVLIESREAQKASIDEYDVILRDTLLEYCFIMSMDHLPSNEDSMSKVCFNIDGGAGNYDLTLEFAKSIVSWDEFSGKAWYEDEKWKNKQLLENSD